VPVFVSTENAGRLGCERATVIPSAVDIDLFTPQPRVEARRALGWAEDRRYVLFPGARARKVKNAPLFDEVLARVRAEEPDVEGVSLEGLSRPQASLVMNAVDVLLMTSHSEGSPVAVREALACMTPVVSVDVGDAALVLDGLPDCGVSSRDPEALARGVTQALGSTRRPELRERAADYSGPRVAGRILELYHRVTEKRPAVMPAAEPSCR